MASPIQRRAEVSPARMGVRIYIGCRNHPQWENLLPIALLPGPFRCWGCWIRTSAIREPEMGAGLLPDPACSFWRAHAPVRRTDSFYRNTSALPESNPTREGGENGARLQGRPPPALR